MIVWFRTDSLVASLTKNAMSGILLGKSTSKVDGLQLLCSFDLIFLAVDQMPLTLHRHYALMQELDQQAHSECQAYRCDHVTISLPSLCRAAISYTSNLHF
jgi:hypothetical protein